MHIFKLLPIIFFCFLSLDSFSQVKFLKDKNWEEAKELSSKSGKPIFIDFYTNWCGPCKKMDKTTFLDSAVSVVLNDQFVSLKLDAKNLNNEEVVKQFDINSYPTYVFASENGNLYQKK